MKKLLLREQFSDFISSLVQLVFLLIKKEITN